MWDHRAFDPLKDENALSVLRALEFAAWAHATQSNTGSPQTREDHRENSSGPVPYIVHPMRVVTLLAQYGESFDVQRAGACHDLLEDTSVKLDELVNVIGRDSTEIVMWVTDHEFKGSREMRSWLKHIKFVRAPKKAKAVKLADMINNTETLGSGKASFWRNCRRGEMVDLGEICSKHDLGEYFIPTNDGLYGHLLEEIRKADVRYPEKEK